MDNNFRYENFELAAKNYFMMIDANRYDTYAEHTKIIESFFMDWLKNDVIILSDREKMEILLKYAPTNYISTEKVFRASQEIPTKSYGPVSVSHSMESVIWLFSGFSLDYKEDDENCLDNKVYYIATATTPVFRLYDFLFDKVMEYTSDTKLEDEIYSKSNEVESIAFQELLGKYKSTTAADIYAFTIDKYVNSPLHDLEYGYWDISELAFKHAKEELKGINYE